LPADTQFAVSGNAMMLKAGKPTPPVIDAARHPRSAVGLSADARTLFIVAVDGRQENHSRGVTLAELANIFIQFGAHNAINLDGGGSTSLVLKDPGSGVFSIANQPSDASTLKLPLRFERPVVDVVGIKLR
jgi:exopolysaccharide biosynthesis protein